jgi:predicted metalloprotease with PDZ domain
MAVAALPPLAGIEGAGWRLAYGATRTALAKTAEGDSGETDLASSIGLRLAKDGTIIDIVPSGPADLAGIPPAARLVAVDGRRVAPRVVRDAIRLAGSGGAVELLVENGEYFSTYRVTVPEGERYARLERAEGGSDLLGAILSPRRP